ncbi:multidrug effflux MFS transporter [Zoogloea sp.]|uniref:multidrug effflux MFS transporter n=1 Tax=Zoogloea sp. TaxID=49181 RepID=UPI00262BD3CF|nr:multidrug effflux MFS transporter [Zoogloea sp.]MDD3354656.1 multidrug effflux MFS transporter [Zoogloea sp.]
MPYAQLAALLAALATVGPFSIDTYLPALQAIGSDLGVSQAEVQQTLTAYMLPLGVMVLWHGALSDAFGRKPVLVAALLVYTLSSLLCVFATDLETLLIGRALQGASSGAGMVVGRAVVRDLTDGIHAQRLMSHVSMTFAVGPAIAPILGGWIFTAFGWRAIFIFLTLLGLILATLTAWKLPESLPPARRHPLHPGPLARRYAAVFTRLGFLLPCLALGLNFNGFFLYVLSAPVFLMEHLGLKETAFGWLFIPGVIGMFGGAALSARLAGRLSQGRTVGLGLGLMGIATLANLAISRWLPPGLPQSVAPILFYNLGMSIAMPSLSLLALDQFPEHRGLAASCQSFLQMLISAMTAGLVAPALWSSTTGLALGMVGYLGLGAACLLLWRQIGWRDEPRPTQAS